MRPQQAGTPSPTDNTRGLQPHIRAPGPQNNHSAHFCAATPTFDSGMLERTCHIFGLDLRRMIRRIMLLLSASNLELLDRVLRGSKIPFNLLEPCAPYLRAHLESMLLSATSTTPLARLRSLTDYASDRVHLSFVGFVAALDAECRHEHNVNVARSGTFVLTSPKRKVLTSADGGANITIADRGAHFDTDDGVWSSAATLHTLYGRWPHLLRLYRSASAAERSAAKTFLQSERSGRSEPLPQVLLNMYFSFLQQGGEAVSVWAHRPGNTEAMQMAGQTKAFLSLVGMTQSDLVRYIWNDADADPYNSIQWMHPSTVQRRVLAALTAANGHLACHSFEGVHLRKIQGPSWHSAATRAARYSAIDRGEGDIQARGAAGFGVDGSEATQGVASDTAKASSAASTFYVPFYALQTQHLETFPNGCKSVHVVYLSDVLHCRQPQPVHAIQTALGEVEALQMLLQNTTPSAATNTVEPPCHTRTNAEHIQRPVASAAGGPGARLQGDLAPELQRLFAKAEQAVGVSENAMPKDAHHAALRAAFSQPGVTVASLIPHPPGAAEVAAAVRRTGSRHGALTSALSSLDSDTAHRLLKRLVMIVCQETDPLLQCKLRLHEPPTPYSPEFLQQGSAWNSAADGARTVSEGKRSPASALKHEIWLESERSRRLSHDDIALRCFAPALNGLSRGMLRQTLVQAKATLGMQALCKVQAGLVQLATHEPETLVFAWGAYTATHTYPWVSLRLAAQRWLLPPSQAKQTHTEEVESCFPMHANTDQVHSSTGHPSGKPSGQGSTSLSSTATSSNPEQPVASLPAVHTHSLAATSSLPASSMIMSAVDLGGEAAIAGAGSLPAATAPRQEASQTCRAASSSKLLDAIASQRSAVKEKAMYEDTQAARRSSSGSDHSAGSEFSAALEQAVEDAVSAAYRGLTSVPQSGQAASANSSEHSGGSIPPPSSQGGGGGGADEGHEAGDEKDAASTDLECCDCDEDGRANWAQWPPNTCGPKGGSALS